MKRSNALSIDVGTAVNALCLSKDNNKVVIAGRSLLKIYHVDEVNGFSEFVNLHVGRKQGLNMSCSDVGWSPVDETLIATAATNGAVVAWDLNVPGRDKKLAILSEHRRTVTKVSFHNSEGNLLLSGSQDGTMKLFDLRKRESTYTFCSKADGVRSAQFNPHEYFTFAASFDNGYVQIWDYRRPSGFVHQFIAHKGSVYTLDWHPDTDHKMTLATGGRDNMVKVWTFENNREKEVNNIPTMSSVASVKWRPHHPEQLATISMMLEFSVNVWHLRRKYVPYVHFQDHTDSVSGIAWKKSDPNYILSCSKDGHLVMHSMRDASCLIDQVASSGLAISSRGHIALVSQTTSSTPRAQSPTGSSSKLPIIFGRKGLTKDSMDFDTLSVSGPSSPIAFQRQNNFLNTKSKFRIFTTSKHQHQGGRSFDDYPDLTTLFVEHLTLNQFRYAARNYILDGNGANLTFEELCSHNSDVALQAGFCDVARTWKLLGVFFHKDIHLNKSQPETTEKLEKTEAKGKRHSLTVKKDEVHRSHIVADAVNHDGDVDHSDDGRLEMEDYLTDIARGRQSEPDLYVTDEDTGFGYGGITSEAEFLSEHEYLVPSEAFQQREDIELDAIAKFGRIDAPSGINIETETEKRILTAHGGRWHEKVVPRETESSSPSSVDEELNISEGVISVCPTLWPAPLDSIKVDVACEQLAYFAEKNDVQSPVCMMLAMSSYPTPYKLPIAMETADHWQNSYLDLLAKNELWVQHAQVIKLSRIPAIQSISSSSTFNLGCQVCQRRMPQSNPWSCDRRADAEHKNRAVTCFYCQRQVRGLYTYCQGCGFGGHSNCATLWMEQCRKRGIPLACKNHCV